MGEQLKLTDHNVVKSDNDKIDPEPIDGKVNDLDLGGYGEGSLYPNYPK